MQDNFYDCALRYAMVFCSNISLRKTMCTIGSKVLNNLLSGCEEIESPLFLDRINRIFSKYGLRSFKII